MAYQEVNAWSLGDLVFAFFDLGLAFFILWISTIVFFTSKLLRVFGIYLPCPCSGFLGFRSRKLCLHKLLFDWPIRRISFLQQLVVSRFPFSSIRGFKDQARVSDLEGEASCSSFTGKRSQNLGDRESGFDVKGKGIVNQKQRYAIRRRRRGVFEHRKLSSVLWLDSSQVVNGREDDHLDDGTSQTRIDLAESGALGEKGGVDVDTDSYSVKKFTCNAQFESGVSGNEGNELKMVQQALEEEKATSAALYLELEKERAAAAIAADEAMAMILRLQNEKASLEMEAMQNRRMTEEKFAYDDEEMYILKEILVRREMKNHLLEKELEAYRQMDCLGTEGDFTNVMDNPNEDPSLMLQQNFNENNNGGNEVGKTSSKLQSLMLDAESTVYDVHVIDDNDNIWKDKIGKERGPAVCNEVLSNHPESGKECGPVGASGVHIGKPTSDHPCTSKAETEPRICGNNIGTNSLPSFNSEMLKIDAAVEWLRERLQIVPEGKQKLTYSGEPVELKFLEEIANHLLKIQQHKEPVQ